MDFRFSGFINDDGCDILRIDFNFLKYSSFIQSLEPEEGAIVDIPEIFSKDEILSFKEILEELQPKFYEPGKPIILNNTLTKEQIDLCNSKLKKLFEYFRLFDNKEINYILNPLIFYRIFKRSDFGLESTPIIFSNLIDAELYILQILCSDTEFYNVEKRDNKFVFIPKEKKNGKINY